MTYPELAGRSVVILGAGPIASATAAAFSMSGAAVSNAVPESGHVDVLVSCVELDPACRPVHDVTDAEWRHALDAVLAAAFRAARALLPRMIDVGGGRMVFVSSQLALSPLWPNSVAYSAAMGGLLGLARHVAKEFGPRGIRSNVVVPGVTLREWELVRGSEVGETILETIPAGRLAEPTDASALVLFLASDGAGYVNGETLQCNGGRAMA